MDIVANITTLTIESVYGFRHACVTYLVSVVKGDGKEEKKGQPRDV
jgi:hypothetical protein